MDTLTALAIIIIPIVLIVWLARTLDKNRYQRGEGNPPANAHRIFLFLIVGTAIVAYIILRFLSAGREALESDQQNILILTGIMTTIAFVLRLYIARKDRGQS
jgi:hypothetical protein